VQEVLNERLSAKLSGRSERRYRRPTPSDPHVNGLMHLALAHMARYTDALRISSSWHSDQLRLSLDSMLNASSLEETKVFQKSTRTPTPRNVWEARREEFGSWPPLLSMRFPKLSQWDDRIVRLAKGNDITDLDPSLAAGSLLLLENIAAPPDYQVEGAKIGWSRPIYVLERGVELICGYLERRGGDYAILSGTHGVVRASFRSEDLANLNRAIGVAVPA